VYVGAAHDTEHGKGERAMDAATTVGVWVTATGTLAATALAIADLCMRYRTRIRVTARVEQYPGMPRRWGALNITVTNKVEQEPKMPRRWGALYITVTNKSAFPVTIADAGLRVRGSGELVRPYPCSQDVLVDRHQEPWEPRKLEPRARLCITYPVRSFWDDRFACARYAVAATDSGIERRSHGCVVRSWARALRRQDERDEKQRLAQQQPEKLARSPATRNGWPEDQA